MKAHEHNANSAKTDKKAAKLVSVHVLHPLHASWCISLSTTAPHWADAVISSHYNIYIFRIIDRQSIGFIIQQAA
jgi:hypothetical protein